MFYLRVSSNLWGENIVTIDALTGQVMNFAKLLQDVRNDDEEGTEEALLKHVRGGNLGLREWSVNDQCNVIFQFNGEFPGSKTREYYYHGYVIDELLLGEFGDYLRWTLDFDTGYIRNWPQRTIDEFLASFRIHMKDDDGDDISTLYFATGPDPIHPPLANQPDGIDQLEGFYLPFTVDTFVDACEKDLRDLRAYRLSAEGFRQAYTVAERDLARVQRIGKKSARLAPTPSTLAFASLPKPGGDGGGMGKGSPVTNILSFLHPGIPGGDIGHISSKLDSHEKFFLRTGAIEPPTVPLAGGKGSLKRSSLKRSLKRSSLNEKSDVELGLIYRRSRSKNRKSEVVHELRRRGLKIHNRRSPKRY